jgi:hypothetical protein
METPSWFDRTKIKITLNALPILASGEHPLQRVMDECASLQKEEIYEVITPFPPIPMIEKLTALGFKNYVEPAGNGVFHTYFGKI